MAGLLPLAGCASQADRHQPAPYRMVATGTLESGIRVYQSEHFTLFSTLSDVDRVGPIIDTLEVGYAVYEDATGVHPPGTAPRMNAYVFQRRSQWEAFTKLRTGPAAAVYLRLHKGGYSFGDACAVVDQGDRDTRAILAHEGFHLFLTTRFIARPPPFIEEGLASGFESILDADGIPRFDPERGAKWSKELPEGVRQRTLRELLGMHAGNVISGSATEVDAFYRDAWSFVRFCREGENGRYRQPFERLLADAAAGRLSSADLEGDAALVERYLGVPLETVDQQFRRYIREKSGSSDRDR